ncbi:dipeptidyl-peptidase-4 [Parabacteroides sp. PF5-5]|uniref:S9 family peptidase n=1 Tax=unclassified Parabacteroides TaxID=2649774 RepID=UPI002475FAAF|nr:MULTISPECIES: S9 family peptidase [unclassified Parabacteroides]MDH6305699.1 dipeptidyl-peptidase-4 [Parabacteroides sp. PH5-39]MDH6316771.1 dipeptidyl-peptidase-4 [Parabacteroides sp. PF5-13]MDH6320412.1 dipeptidyl-peptidase-4 [Parabacteroides sp. PH5-13]MDH6324142.1 dipeptidyl-peptidase-4 [Parabacteroides sp. PH5-8]MDH6327957.1 dipeptidyl-peptidase-4 [Parabacteroides sp. PH5-41]
MKQTVISLLFSLVVVGSSFAQNGSKRIELKDITDGKFRQTTAIGEMRSLPDGEHYTAMNKERTMIIKYAYRTGNPVDTLFYTKKARECTFDDFDGYAICNTGHQIIVWRDTERIYRHSFRADVFHYDVRRNYVKPLSDEKGKLMIPTFSPDGRMCAFVRDNNIWIKKFDFDTEVQVTKDGEINKILNGITDWVYEEEFRATNLMAWSPDSEVLAYVRFDESNVPEMSMQIYGDGLYPSYYNFKYPKAGEPNSKVTLHSYSVATKDIKELKVPVESDSYIPRILFTENPDQLAVMTLNRHQNGFNMYYVNPKSGVSRLILKENNQAYIDSDWLYSIHFCKDGFTYVSEQDGYAHVYLYSPTGVMLRQITSGNWDVTKLYGYNQATQTAFYESAEESPLRRAVYMVDAKGKKTKLSAAEGTNSAVFSDNFAYYVNTFSNASTPAVISVNETKSGKVLRTLLDNARLKEQLNAYAFSPKEFIKIHTASDYELNAWMVKPVNFDPNKKYPVLMIQYSGPNSQQVVDRYALDWEQYLASNGFIVVSVDGRGTGARGEAFRKCTYLKMGVLEAKDQAEAARELGKLPYIDKDRIAIWGWSFGGYTTLMAMSTGNGAFKAGIAVAPPTDWKYYDTVYTERFMRTPKENFEGYAATSPIRLAKNLQGKLLLVHGTADDNVHFAQSMEYAEALVQANKQFEMHLYKDRNHSISGGNTRYHLYTRMADFLFKNL